MQFGKPPFSFTLDDGRVSYHGHEAEKSVRTFSELKGFLREPACLEKKKTGDLKKTAYSMHRGLLTNAGLRYDVTILYPAQLGRERTKTVGHYHPPAPQPAGTPPGTPARSYLEAYEVWAGEAHYLLQERLAEGKVGRVFLVKAQPGDTVLVPPNFGHVTINPGKKPLVMANAVCGGFDSDYHEYHERRGAAMYELDDGTPTEGSRARPASANPRTRGARLKPENHAEGFSPRSVTLEPNPRWQAARTGFGIFNAQDFSGMFQTNRQLAATGKRLLELCATTPEKLAVLQKPELFQE